MTFTFWQKKKNLKIITRNDQVENMKQILD